MHLNDLREMEIKKLNKLATELKVENSSAMKKHEVIFAVLKAKANTPRSATTGKGNDAPHPICCTLSHSVQYFICNMSHTHNKTNVPW